MATNLTFRVTAEEDGRLLQRVLKNRYAFSRRFLRKLKQHDGVTVNGAPVYLTSRVKTGDTVSIMFPPEEATSVIPEPMSLEIIHEDEDVIVLNKQPGIVVHPTKHYVRGTLANGLMHYWQGRGNHHVVRPVNRLDKDTSGVIVFAKHAYAHDFLVKQLHSVHSVRAYRAIVHGTPSHDHATIDAPIARDPAIPSQRIVHPGGARAVTHYEVIQRFPEAAYLACRLETGRTHQIRVHMRSIGHPLIGDPIYGHVEQDSDIPINRQALHANAVQFLHPRSKKVVRFEAMMPQDLQMLLKRCQDNKE